MERKRIGRKLLLAFIVVLSISALITACGGGGSSSSSSSAPALSGTVASGSPVSGIVYVKGSLGNFTSVAIKSDGTYRVTVGDLTPPYLIHAEGTVDGKSIELFSTATSTGTINVTPITDFIVRSLLGAVPDDDTWTTDYNSVTDEALDAVEATIQAQLQPILDALGLVDIDLLEDSFEADHTGMDQLLDILDITYNGNVATVTNELNGESYDDDVTTEGDDDNGMAEDPSDVLDVRDGAIAEIAAVWTSLQSVINATYANQDAYDAAVTVWINENVSSQFLDEGEDKAALIENWVTEGDGPRPGMTFTDIAIKKDITPMPVVMISYNTIYEIEVTINYGGMTDKMDFVMAKTDMAASSSWEWYGNREWVGVGETPLSYMSYTKPEELGSVGVISPIVVGLQFYVRDENQYAYNNNVNSVVVTGAGLPATGILLDYDEFSNDSLWPFNQEGMDNMTDEAVAAIGDNEEYTIELCDQSAGILYNTADPAANCSVLHTQFHTNPKPPVSASDLTATDFYNITDIGGNGTDTDITLYNFGGNITVNWTNPVGVSPYRVRISLDSTAGYQSYGNDEDMSSSTTSYTIDTTGASANPWNASITVEGYDSFDRKVSSTINLWGLN